MRLFSLTTAATALILTAVAVSCGGDDDDDDSGNDCGSPLAGVTCVDENDECTDLVCVDGAWACPEGTSEAAVTADGPCLGAGGAGGAGGSGS
jgi:hypothetical protein